MRKNSSVLSERAKGGMHMCNKKELSFSIFMIYSLADKWKMSPAKVYKILNSTGILDDYIIKCYDVLHTQGKEYLVEDITDFVKEKGVRKGVMYDCISWINRNYKKSRCSSFKKVFGFWQRILYYDIRKSGKEMGSR